MQFQHKLALWLKCLLIMSVNNLCCLSCQSGMADAESQPVMEGAEAEVAAAASESMFSTLDLIVLALLGVAAVYYVILRNRKKEEELAQMQTFTIT